MSDTATLPPTLPPSTGAEEQEHWTSRHAKPVIFLIITFVAIGIYLAFAIPIAVFPETNFPRIIVGLDNGVAPINQMQATVTRPVEEALNAVPGLEKVWSITSRGTAEIDLFFDWSVDIFQTLNLVNAALAQVRPSLPSTTNIVANRLTFAAFPIIGYSLTSSNIPQTRLWELATYTIKPRLNRIPGVSTVVVQGGQVPEFHIIADPSKMLETQVTVPGILDAISKSNLIDSPGLFEHNHDLVLSLVSGQAIDPTQIANMVVKTSPAGTPIRIGDIGHVQNGVLPVYTVVTANGKPAVLVNINRQPAGNTVAIADALYKELSAIKKSLPPGIQISSFYDQSELVRDSIDSVRDAILVGLILAAIILVLFLRDWGSSLVAGMVIPATIAITLIVLRLTGQSFNLMTLGGLAAAVGLVIDDAIVVVENIVLHRDAGQSRGQAIRSAMREIWKPLVGSTVTPIVVFVPLITIEGVTGVFFRALAITVGVALLTSLALAVTWTPTLSHFLLRRQGASGRKHEDEGERRGVMGRIVNVYERVLTFTLAHSIVLVLGALLVIGGGYFCYTIIGSDLLPTMDEGGFILDYLMPAGSSLQDTNQVISGVEKILANTKEVASTSRRTGLQLGLAAVTEANRGDISVKLTRHRDKSLDEVISEVRKEVNEKYPQLDVEFPLVLQDMIGDLTGSPEPIEIKLFSQNQGELSTWAARVADAIKKLGPVKDVKNGIENTISGPAVIYHVDPVVAARSGFTPQEVETDVSATMQGEPAPTPVVLNDRPYTLRVLFPPANRESVQTIQNTMLVSSTGKTATLGTLSQVEEVPGQTEIRRENLQRDVAVTGRFEGISLGKGIELVKGAVAKLGVPGSIRIEYGGTYQEQQKSFHDLLVVLMIAIVLVFIVLLFEFGSFSAPVSILLSALLSTAGVFVALLVTGTTFNISSFMGVIMVVGIVAKNGILLLDADQKFRAEGASPREAMIKAGERRLRPIMMTAMATVAGMIPLALGIGAGSQMLQPLAIAVIGGILASMVLSLIVTPAAYYRMSHEK
jgi:CzcA family heavy metal efflux pump